MHGWVKQRAAGFSVAQKLRPDDGDATPLQLFERFFEVIPASDPDLIRRAQELRYEVYCLERGFESRSEHPDGVERDEFDTRAMHSLLIHRPSGEAVGTVRLVQVNPTAPDASFAIQRVCSDPILKNRSLFPVDSMAEISRFSISKKFRRRADDTFYGPEIGAPPIDSADRRKTPPMRLGLMQAILSMSAELKITHWCAVMEPTLLRILAASCIHFDPIGPVIDYHGRRQPCHADIRKVLNRLRAEQKEIWDIVTKEGTIWEQLCQAWS